MTTRPSGMQNCLQENRTVCIEHLFCVLIMTHFSSFFDNYPINNVWLREILVPHLVTRSFPGMGFQTLLALHYLMEAESEEARILLRSRDLINFRRPKSDLQLLIMRNELLVYSVLRLPLPYPSSSTEEHCPMDYISKRPVFSFCSINFRLSRTKTRLSHFPDRP